MEKIDTHFECNGFGCERCGGIGKMHYTLGIHEGYVPGLHRVMYAPRFDSPPGTSISYGYEWGYSWQKQPACSARKLTASERTALKISKTGYEILIEHEAAQKEQTRLLEKQRFDESVRRQREESQKRRERWDWESKLERTARAMIAKNKLHDWALEVLKTHKPLIQAFLQRDFSPMHQRGAAMVPATSCKTCMKVNSRFRPEELTDDDFKRVIENLIADLWIKYHKDKIDVKLLVRVPLEIKENDIYERVMKFIFNRGKECTCTTASSSCDRHNGLANDDYVCPKNPAHSFRANALGIYNKEVAPSTCCC